MSMSLDKQKFEYLKIRYHFSLEPGIKKILAHCEFCEVKIPTTFRISKKLIGYNYSSNGRFCKDESGLVHLLCSSCEGKLRDWGGILRWLEKIDKSAEDLPTEWKLGSRYRSYW